MTKSNIYLDYAAATPLDKKVLASMEPYFSDVFYNPSAPYQPAREVRNDIEKARHEIAQIIGGRSSEIIFTAGASESINLAFTVDGHVVTTQTEHLAVLESAKNHPQGHTIVTVAKDGMVSIDELAKAVEQNTKLISISVVNNEIGTIQDVKAISQFVQTVREERQKENNPHPIYLHVDASQAAGIVDLHVSRLGVDMMTLNGGKVYGPKQMGALYVHSSIPLQPLIQGGGQERGLRSGTENVAGIVGFAKALAIAESQRKEEFKRLQNLKDQMRETLQTAFEDIEILSPKHSAPHILSIAWPGVDAERVLFALEAEGVLVATGSACAANKDTRSHVLTALGLPEQIIDGSLRLSFGRQTTSEQVERAAKIIVMVVNKELERVSNK